MLNYLIFYIYFMFWVKMPSQISLMGDFQVEDSRSVVHSNTNHRKIVSLTKVSNRKAHWNRVFRKTKHKRYAQMIQF